MQVVVGDGCLAFRYGGFLGCHLVYENAVGYYLDAVAVLILVCVPHLQVEATLPVCPEVPSKCLNGASLAFGDI
jgi:hypothetical protein